MTYLDDEVDRIREHPQSSPADVQDAESFRLTMERRWEAEVKALAAQREQVTTEKQSRLYEQIRDAQRASDENRRALDAGDLSVPEFLSRAGRIKGETDEFERRLQGLESASALIEEMRGDPVGWKDSFYEKWTSLQHGRPSIDAWIEEARRGRRDRSRERGSKK